MAAMDVQSFLCLMMMNLVLSASATGNFSCAEIWPISNFSKQWETYCTANTTKSWAMSANCSVAWYATGPAAVQNAIGKCDYMGTQAGVGCKTFDIDGDQCGAPATRDPISSCSAVEEPSCETCSRYLDERWDTPAISCTSIEDGLCAYNPTTQKCHAKCWFKQDPDRVDDDSCLADKIVKCDSPGICCPEGTSCIIPRGGSEVQCVGPTDRVFSPIPCPEVEEEPETLFGLPIKLAYVVIGSSAFVLLVCFCACCYCYRHKRDSNQKTKFYSRVEKRRQTIKTQEEEIAMARGKSEIWYLIDDNNVTQETNLYDLKEAVRHGSVWGDTQVRRHDSEVFKPCTAVPELKMLIPFQTYSRPQHPKSVSLTSPAALSSES